MAIDLQQFHEVFFVESLEGLDVMEQALLTIQEGQPLDPEIINTIFRAAHSIKGGSGTFGFDEIADFTHVLETLLDEVRDGKRDLPSDNVDLLLKSCDCLRDMVAALQAEQPVDTSASLPLVAAFEAILSGSEAPAVVPPSALGPASVASPAAAPHEQNGQLAVLEEQFDTLLSGGDGSSASEETAGASVADAPPASPVDTGGGDSGSGAKQWRILFHPQPQILMTGNEPLRIFRELAALGELRSVADTSGIPQFDQLTVDECFVRWTLWLTADVERDDILEVFDWVIDECELQIDQIADQPEALQQQPSAAEQPFEPELSVQPEAMLAETEVASESDVAPAPTAAPTPSSVSASAPVEAAKASSAQQQSTPTTSSIRVDIDKVDSLINLVGELVITQSMLSELGNDFAMEKLERLANGLEQLQQNTRELQESVMRIRMLPISFAFNRFPRMIRDLSSRTGKKVSLKLSGENTELDKTVMEQISDPLVHLVRNAVDHGLELPEKRLASGKDETGTIHLNAYHKGGNIVIEISDDGNGIDPQKILAKAKQKGVVAEDQDLSDDEIYNLIFEPGFSTAEVVSDISGRGVGMDVVRRNIVSLGGRIEVDSELGRGSTFRVHLPLTLAILDGQLIRVGTEVYIVPLISIVESLQVKSELVNQVAGNMTLYRLREDNVPIIPIHKVFGIEADSTELEEGLLVVVESEGQKIGLQVDDLLAQQQVVIKSLERNYKRVEGISGATILGDGSVSMILDVPGLVRLATEKGRQAA